MPEQGYNLIYRKYDRNEGLLNELVRYELTDGNNLYLVKATYAKTLPPSKYYIVAPNSRIAKQKFKSIFSWLNYITSVEPVKGDLLEFALTHPNKIYLR